MTGKGLCSVDIFVANPPSERGGIGGKTKV